MNRNSEFEKEQAKEIMEEEEKNRINPLRQYSTTALKAELRRRKNE